MFQQYLNAEPIFIIINTINFTTLKLLCQETKN